ncbi:hypothetical protein AUJ77_00545 [Candidatus Nomurabacteria bacterium CG1_02_43_90]|uniref:Large ribosomal subunit protein uL29 n=1 Tax=Candidatus Nomurabacteria bacterium CG1_02_43_90 TaxID=1805281 RepID=A0A1J4V595_9BACT|nr:MAG: hypothetical protein AUJ77_00545 [Candidatus Nomurabacteria bacterium CG1_02_43_90]
MNEYKKKSAEDLMKLLNEKREVVRAFRFDITGSAKKNVKVSVTSRREIARILTELNIRKNNTSEVNA